MLTELKSERSPECISDLVFDEWSAGELDAERVRGLEAHLATCDRCAARKRALTAGAESFLQVHPMTFGGAKVVPLAVPQKKRPWYASAGGGIALTLAAAAAVFLLVMPKDGGIRTKGGAHVGFYVKRGDQVTPGTNGEKVRAGDRVRFVVTSGQERYLAILSLDSRGTVSLFSSPSLATTPMIPGTEQPLEGSVELDDSPGTERVFAVFCTAPIDVQRLQSTLEKTRELRDVEGCTVDPLILNKEAQ